MSRRDYLKDLGFATSAAMATANQTKTMSNEPTIAEMNWAICEFMGWEFKPDGEDWFKAYHDGGLMWADTGYGLDQILLKGFRYHESWDKLMPVGKRIRDLLSDMLSKRPPHTACMGDVIEVDITCALHEYDIKKVHEAIYVFIKWYKQQSNDQPH